MELKSTFVTLITPTTSANKKLNSYAVLYGKIERALYASIKANKISATERKNTFLKQYNITSRQYNSILRMLNGKLSSKVELNKLYITETVGRIKSVEITVNRMMLEEKVLKGDTLTKKGKGKARAIKRHEKLCFRLHMKKRYLARQKDKLATLKNAHDVPDMCFGSKKLFNAQHHLKENGYADIAEWKQDWQAARTKQFVVVGSKDESWGNQNAQLTLNKRTEEDGVHQNIRFLMNDS